MPDRDPGRPWATRIGVMREYPPPSSGDRSQLPEHHPDRIRHGCGPGQVAAYLHAQGVPVFGIDLSPRMVALARQAHPDLRFSEGSRTALDLPDGSVGGIVACYSIIHLPTEQLPE